MRWDGLFADLEAQAAALQSAERNAEVEERTRAEAGRLTLLDRLRPAVGAPVRVRTRGGVSVTGHVQQVGSEWLLLDEGSGHEVVVALPAVTSIAGLGRLSAVPGTMGVVQLRLGLRHVLRGIARDRSNLRLHLVDDTVMDGTLDRVGADFLEFAVHAPGESRRRSEVREVLVVALSALAVLRRQG